MRKLTLDDARAAVYGGLLFGAGGGGLENGLRVAELVFELGPPTLAELSDLRDDDLTVVTTGVGAPGAKKNNSFPRDRLRAFELVREAVSDSDRIGSSAGRLAGTIIGHPGAHMPGSWLHSAADPQIMVVDCATNGRGHPSVKMGGMGLASRTDVSIVQSAVGGVADDEIGRLEIVLRGPLSTTSDVVRQASSQLGGSISACRGPFTVGFLRGAGAVGAVSESIRVGSAMLDAHNHGASALIDAVTDTLGGIVAVAGEVQENTVALQGAYDAGQVRLSDGNREASLAICNEYMALDTDGQRVATFPDLIVALDENTGMPVSAAGIKTGDHIVVVTVPRDNIPVGAGVDDPSAYSGVERLIGCDLATHAIRNGENQ